MPNPEQEIDLTLPSDQPMTQPSPRDYPERAQDRDVPTIAPAYEGVASVGNAPPAGMVPVEIDSGDQPWCTIYLKDGNKLRIQLAVASVHRNDNKMGPDGMPEYVIGAGFHTQAFPRKQRK